MTTGAPRTADATPAGDPRGAVVADACVVGEPLRRSLTTAVDRWLRDLAAAALPTDAPWSLVAVGSLGRQEPVPGGDLDLVLVVPDRLDDPAAVAEVADRLWYPVWDAGVRLDHSVRTVAQAREVARADLKVALGLLDARCVAGDPEPARRLLSAVREDWRTTARRRLPELAALVRERHTTAGEVAAWLEPDLKEGRGGLRDVGALQALAAAQVLDPPRPPVLDAARVLLDVRGEVHRLRGGRGGARDRLLLHDQDAVAAALGLPDADVLARCVADAGRTVAVASDHAWRRVLPPEAPRRRLRLRRGARPVERRPLAPGVVEHEGEVELARDATPELDPGLVLRAAAAAADAGLPLALATLDRLARDAPPLPEPWPASAREAFVRLLATGPAAVGVVEALDDAGLWVRLVPEWARVRSLTQRNALHRFTVDRHQLETAAAAAALTRRVQRPDLLLLGALFHDMGKGLPGDHSEVGEEVVAGLGRRMGLGDADLAVLRRLVRHHLLLPDTATRRDPRDPQTLRLVTERVVDEPSLHLLHALTEADGAATGPAAWSSWKASLVSVLVREAAAALGGQPPSAPPERPDASRLLDAVDGTAAVAVEDADPPVAGVARVHVAGRARRGLLAAAAGVLASHRLDVRQAVAGSEEDVGLITFTVSSSAGRLPDVGRLRDDLVRALDGRLDLHARLAERERSSATLRRPPVGGEGVAVRWDEGASETSTVLDVRGADTAGLLFRLASALHDAGLDVRSARVSTLGHDAVDAFYVRTADGRPVDDPPLRAEVEERVRAAAAAGL